jgi:hypothetical protein
MVGENILIPLEKHRLIMFRFVFWLPLCEPEPAGELKKQRPGKENTLHQKISSALSEMTFVRSRSKKHQHLKRLH